MPLDPIQQMRSRPPERQQLSKAWFAVPAALLVGLAITIGLNLGSSAVPATTATVDGAVPTSPMTTSAKRLTEKAAPAATVAPPATPVTRPASTISRPATPVTQPAPIVSRPVTTVSRPATTTAPAVGAVPTATRTITPPVKTVTLPPKPAVTVTLRVTVTKTVRTFGLTTTAPAAKSYPRCAAMHVDYPHGVGKRGARDNNRARPVETFFVSNAIYAMNDGYVAFPKQYNLDADNDGIACERA